MTEKQEQNASVDPLNIGEFISLAEAAQISGLSHSHLKELAQKGRLRAKKIARNWLTTIAALEEYKKSRNFENIPKKYRNRT